MLTETKRVATLSFTIIFLIISLSINIIITFYCLAKQQKLLKEKRFTQRSKLIIFQNNFENLWNLIYILFFPILFYSCQKDFNNLFLIPIILYDLTFVLLINLRLNFIKKNVLSMNKYIKEIDDAYKYVQEQVGGPRNSMETIIFDDTISLWEKNVKDYVE